MKKIVNGVYEFAMVMEPFGLKRRAFERVEFVSQEKDRIALTGRAREALVGFLEDTYIPPVGMCGVEISTYRHREGDSRNWDLHSVAPVSREGSDVEVMVPFCLFEISRCEGDEVIVTLDTAPKDEGQWKENLERPSPAGSR